MMFSNLAIGLIMLLAGLFAPEVLGPLGEVLPFGGALMGGMLTLACAVASIGMWVSSRTLAKYGAMFGLFTWVFGCVLFLSVPGGGYNVIVFVIPYLLYFIYLYLAAVFRVKHMQLKD